MKLFGFCTVRKAIYCLYSCWLRRIFIPPLKLGSFVGEAAARIFVQDEIVPLYTQPRDLKHCLLIASRCDFSFCYFCFRGAALRLRGVVKYSFARTSSLAHMLVSDGKKGWRTVNDKSRSRV